MIKGSLSSLLALLLVLPLFVGCASEDSQMMEDDAAMRDVVLDDVTEAGGMDPLIARMRELEEDVQFIATKKSWSTRIGGGEEVSGAWVRGHYLMAQVFNSESGKWEIHTVDVKTGKPKWLVVLGDNKLAKAPEVGDGVIAFLTENDASMVVVNSVTGGRIYNMRTNIATVPVSTATGAGDTVYVSNYLSGKMTAISAESGVKGWDFDTRGICRSAPIVSTGLPTQYLIYGTDAGEIVALRTRPYNSARPGGAAWKHVLHGPMTAAPSYGTVGEGDDKKQLVVFPCEDGWLYGCDPATGRRRWVARTETPFTEQALIRNNRVYARNGVRFMAIDATSGRRLWRAEKDENQSAYEYEQMFSAPTGYELAQSPLAANENNVFVSMGPGKVARISAGTGNVESVVDFSQFAHMVQNPATGDLILGTADGIFVAFQ